MKTLKNVLPRAAIIFLIFTIVCGVVYTAVVTGIAQVIFPYQANGSIIEIDGKKYGCELLGQQYGKVLMYATPSNLSPASEEYEALVAERVDKIKASNPDMGDTPIPVDLVTCSGSGLDPEISPAAAEYQVARIAKARNISEDEVREVIEKCTSGKFLGVFGEERVNVLKVNLMLDGILK